MLKTFAGKSLFITGTDTDVGKSVITAALALCLEKMGYDVAVYKPLQSGAYFEKDGLIAPDLAFVRKFSKTIACKCSYLLEGECSPALAMKLARVPFSLGTIKADFTALRKEHDIVLVEGAGGLLCPVSFENKLAMADIIQYLALPCLIVARSGLGTINHCLLTEKIAKQYGLHVNAFLLNRFPEKTAETTLKTDRSVSAGSKKQSVLNALRERQARMKAQEKRGEKSQTHKKGEQEL